MLWSRGLAGRYRAHGPPTFLNWTLVTLGYSALFQGKHDQAEQYFDEAASFDLPDRTMSVNKARRGTSRHPAWQPGTSVPDPLLPHRRAARNRQHDGRRGRLRRVH